MSGGGNRTKAVNLNQHIDHSPATDPLLRTATQPGTTARLGVSARWQGSLCRCPLAQEKSVCSTARVGSWIELPWSFGPAGLALDAKHQRLYVLNHFDATLSVVNLRTRQTIVTVSLRHDPTPAVVKQGRPFLYDATLTSRNGDLSCATCHVFGDRGWFGLGPRRSWRVKLSIIPSASKTLSPWRNHARPTSAQRSDGHPKSTRIGGYRSLSLARRSFWQSPDSRK